MTGLKKTAVERANLLTSGCWSWPVERTQDPLKGWPATKVGWAWSKGSEGRGGRTGHPLEGTEPGSGLLESLSDLFGLVSTTVELCSHNLLLN